MFLRNEDEAFSVSRDANTRARLILAFIIRDDNPSSIVTKSIHRKDTRFACLFVNPLVAKDAPHRLASDDLA